MSEEKPNSVKPEKHNFIKWLIPLALFIIFIIGLVLSWKQNPGSKFKQLPSLNPEQIQNAELAPDFEMLDINGNRVRLKDFRGKAVLLNFWSITCPACLMELRSLASLSEQLSGKPFALIALTSNSRGDIKEFLDETGLKLPVYFDITGEAASRYRVYYLPVSFVIDPEGRLVDKFAGAADWSDPSVITYFQKLIELYQPKKPSP